MPRCALGHQGIHLVTATAEKMAELDRDLLRTKIKQASVRPSPGTSDLLGRPLRAVTVAVVDYDGKVKAVDVHDLTALMPVHLVGHPLALHTKRRGS